MCLFSRPVTSVSETKIFARIDGSEQVLVYAMKLSAREDLAMVLPVPTPPGVSEDAVSFVSFANYSKFFEDLDRTHWIDHNKTYSLEKKGLLKVHDVGRFQASFVPGREQLDRLDPRFRLPDAVWDRVAEYADYGFVVFKLERGTKQKPHPMAFRFPNRHPDTIYFPTLHLHDGEALPHEAGFDHVLYFQSDGEPVPHEFAVDPLEAEPFDPRSRDWARPEPAAVPLRASALPWPNEKDWMRSPQTPGEYMRVEKTQGLVRADQDIYKGVLKGDCANKDVRVRVGRFRLGEPRPQFKPEGMEWNFTVARLDGGPDFEVSWYMQWHRARVTHGEVTEWIQVPTWKPGTVRFHALRAAVAVWLDRQAGSA